MRNGRDISDVSHPTSGEKPSAADQRSRRLCVAHKVPGLLRQPPRKAEAGLLSPKFGSSLLRRAPTRSARKLALAASIEHTSASLEASVRFGYVAGTTGAR
jgi:hypothetical protein